MNAVALTTALWLELVSPNLGGVLFDTAAEKAGGVVDDDLYSATGTRRGVYKPPGAQLFT